MNSSLLSDIEAALNKTFPDWALPTADRKHGCGPDRYDRAAVGRGDFATNQQVIALAKRVTRKVVETSGSFKEGSHFRPFMRWIVMAPKAASARTADMDAEVAYNMDMLHEITHALGNQRLVLILLLLSIVTILASPFLLSSFGIPMLIPLFGGIWFIWHHQHRMKPSEEMAAEIGALLLARQLLGVRGVPIRLIAYLRNWAVLLPAGQRPRALRRAYAEAARRAEMALILAQTESTRSVR